MITNPLDEMFKRGYEACKQESHATNVLLIITIAFLIVFIVFDFILLRGKKR